MREEEVRRVRERCCSRAESMKGDSKHVACRREHTLLGSFSVCTRKNAAGCTRPTRKVWKRRVIPQTEPRIWGEKLLSTFIHPEVSAFPWEKMFVLVLPAFPLAKRSAEPPSHPCIRWLTYCHFIFPPDQVHGMSGKTSRGEANKIPKWMSRRRSWHSE